MFKYPTSRSIFSVLLILLFCTRSFGGSTIDTIYLEGVACVQKGQFDIALEIFSNLIDENHASFKYYLARGNANYNLKNYSAAIQDFQRANLLKTDVANYEIACCYALSGYDKNAISYLHKYLLTRTKKSEAEIVSDPAFSSIQNIPEWIELWKEDWYNKTELVIDQVDYLLKYHRNLDALNEIDKALDGKTKPSGLYAAKAKVLDSMLNYIKAEDYYSKALESNSKNTGYYIDRARVRAKLKKPEKAYEDYTVALQIQPELFNIYLERARICIQLKNFDQGISDVSFYLYFFDTELEAKYLLGELQYSNENYLDALRSFNQIIAIDTTSAKYFLARGKTYISTNTYKYALADLSMSLDLDDTNPEAYLYKGIARYYLKDTQGACRDWQKAANMGSNEAIGQILEHCDK